MVECGIGLDGLECLDHTFEEQEVALALHEMRALQDSSHNNRFLTRMGLL
jgi:hypothetical protein